MLRVTDWEAHRRTIRARRRSLRGDAQCHVQQREQNVGWSWNRTEASRPRQGPRSDPSHAQHGREEEQSGQRTEERGTSEQGTEKSVEMRNVSLSEPVFVQSHREGNVVCPIRVSDRVAWSARESGT
jgi:hypothetical protein